MKKTNTYFDFALPIAINTVSVKEESLFIFQEYPMIMVVLKGKTEIIRFCRKRTALEGGVVLVDRNSPVVVSNADSDEALILVLTFDINYYRKRHPAFANTVFINEGLQNDRNFIVDVLNVAMIAITQDDGGLKTLQTMIDGIISMLITKYQFFSYSLCSGDDPKVETAHIALIKELMIYLDSNYQERSALRRFAEARHISPNYASHLIKKVSGKSFQEILAIVRCMKSQEFLLDESYRINELAYDIGFSSPQYYKDNFQKIFSLTPNEYRRFFVEGDFKAPYFDSVPEKIETLIKAFAHRHKYNLTLMSDTIYTRDVVNADNILDKYNNHLSNTGRISNIKTEMTEPVHQAFDEIHKAFRISVITIDVMESLDDSDNSTLLTIARNINYLTRLGFDIAFETKTISRKCVDLLIRFLVFYSRIFHDNASYLKILLRSKEHPDIIMRQQRQLKQEVQTGSGVNIDVIVVNGYVNEVNFMSSIYDSFILAPFAMDELFAPDRWKKEIAFSLIDEVNPNGSFLNGGNGLLTWNGIKKPWWYAYMFVSKLRGDIISKGSDHIITNDNGRIVILTFNLCRKSPMFLMGINSNKLLSEEIQKAKGLRREHSFHITNITGKYKATHYNINQSACLYSKWQALGFPSYMTGDEEDIMSAVCHPEVSFSIVEAAEELDITTVEESFGVSLVILEKLD